MPDFECITSDLRQNSDQCWSHCLLKCLIFTSKIWWHGSENSWMLGVSPKKSLGMIEFHIVSKFFVFVGEIWTSLFLFCGASKNVPKTKRGQKAGSKTKKDTLQTCTNIFIYWYMCFLFSFLIIRFEVYNTLSSSESITLTLLANRQMYWQMLSCSGDHVVYPTAGRKRITLDV